MKYNFNPRYFKTLYAGLAILVCILVLIRPMQLLDDSYGYIQMYLNRPPAYPLFLAIIRSIFGDFFDIGVKVFQLSFGVFSVSYLLFTLKKYIKINPIWYLILAIILFAPYLYNHHIANRYLTEALAFPFYLIIVGLLVKYIYTKRNKFIVWVAIVLFFLLLTRKQFLFIIPIILLLLAWNAYQTKKLKNNILLTILLIMLPFLASIADKCYHYAKHGVYVTTPWNGIHLLGNPMFVADEQDIGVFKTEEEQNLFQKIFSEVKKKRLNTNYLLEKNEDYIESYEKDYPVLVNNTIYPIGMAHFEQKGLSEDEALIALDKTTTQMAFPLLVDNFGKWAKLYLKNIIYGFENSKYLLLYIILGIFFTIKSFFSKSPAVYRVMAILILFTIANVCIVATGMHTIKRFLFYNDWTLFFVTFFFLNNLSNNFLRKKKN